MSKALAIIGAVALALVTLASPAATRMFTGGWREIAAVAYLAPVLILLLRGLDPANPLVAPPARWFALAVGWSVVVMASAFFSPYRGQAVLWSAPLLAMPAVLLVAYDWLNREPAAIDGRRRALVKATATFLGMVVVASFALWLSDVPALLATGSLLAARNPYPLGHSNYTAGIALLLLPAAAWLAASETHGRRWLWIVAVAAAIGLLFTSGSRGGLLGLGVLGLAAIPTASRLMRIRIRWIALAIAIVLIGLVATNPRLRSLVGGGADLSVSDVQRSAMTHVGLKMGAGRPVLGWGPGTTPLVYPRFRAAVAGGADTVLQLHSAPLELWGTLGLGGLLVALLAGVLVLRDSPKVMGLALSGYAVFSLTDWQIDVPVFAFALALALALAARPPDHKKQDLTPSAKGSGLASCGRAVGWLAIGGLGLFIALARRDPTPDLNTRALHAAQDPATKAEAVRLFNQSLARNQDQEIAHFNLGWLLVVSDPAAAQAHFMAAARLVPNKGGVYFGIGLAELNRADRAAAAGAFALEALNDPLFLTSPWWRNPALAPLLDTTNESLEKMIAEVVARTDIDSRTAAEAKYVGALAEWLAGKKTSAQMLGVSETTERVGYFSRRPQLPAFKDAAVTVFRRERTGYPVLMRNLDVPVPTDVFDVQENALARGEFSFLFPAKGWLPDPILAGLLNDTIRK